MKKHKSLIAIIIGMVVLSVIGIIIAINTWGADNKKAKACMEEGNRFLDELEYEKAIAMYEEVIKIDPKMVEAYSAIAEAYIALGEPEEAVKWLKEGYYATADNGLLEDIEKKCKEYNITFDKQQFLGEMQKESDKDKQKDGTKGKEDAFSGVVVDGVYHQQYRDYPLTEEQKNFLKQIVVAGTSSDFGTVFGFVEDGSIYSLLAKMDKDSPEVIGGEFLHAYIKYEDYKIHLRYVKGGSNITYMITVIPIFDGMGCALEYWDSGDMIRHYQATVECADAMFNGELSYSYTDTKEGNVVWQYGSGTATVVNGLLHGTRTYTETNEYTDDSVRTDEYDMGLRITNVDPAIEGQYFDVFVLSCRMPYEVDVNGEKALCYYYY